MASPLLKHSILLLPAVRLPSRLPRAHSTLPEHSTAGDASRPRINELGIPMLSPRLHAQVFGGAAAPADPARVRDAISHLSEHGLWGRQADVFDEPSLDIPPLTGDSLEEHFRLEAEQQAGPYRDLLQSLISRDIPPPPAPTAWRLQPGWTRYSDDGAVTAVPAPACDALVLDVEVVVRRQLPVLATAVSPDAWYGWVSPYLLQDTPPDAAGGGRTLRQLIPLEDDAYSSSHSSSSSSSVSSSSSSSSASCSTSSFPFPSSPDRSRVIVGHNVSYDRSWVREPYRLRPDGTRFVDTMSMHIAVGGITSQQRAMMLGARRADARPRRVHHDLDWMSQTSMNSLADVFKHYCGEKLDKEERDVFLKGDVRDVRDQFGSLMAYCAGDARATWRVLKKLLPEFLERFPHPVTLAGTLHMGQVYLPVGPAWQRYLHLCSETYTDLENELSAALRRVADAACRAAHNDRHRHDPWLWDLDWSVAGIKVKKAAAGKRATAAGDGGGRAGADAAAAASATSAGLTMEASGDGTNAKQKRKTKRKKKDVEAEECQLPRDWQEPVRRLTSEEFTSDAPLPDPLTERFAPLWRTVDRLYKRQPLLPGYPKWYRDLCNKDGSGLTELTTSKRVVPKLLRLTWNGYPLHYDRRFGWGYVVPGRPGDPGEPWTTPAAASASEGSEEESEYDNEDSCDGDDQISETGVNSKTVTVSEISETADEASELAAAYDDDDEDDDCEGGAFPIAALRSLCASLPAPDSDQLPIPDVRLRGASFYPLPHRDGLGNNVGNPLSKHFLAQAEAGVLRADAGAGSSAERVLRVSQTISYWRNNQDRILSQRAVLVPREDLPQSVTNSEEYQKGKMYGAILPQVKVAGTLTRRAVERTWLTASNVRPDRLGSELRAMVQAPPGYHIVGADVDSQELWIAALLSDSAFAGIHGSTAFSWMTLQGKKSEGTDLHSRTASLVGVSRDLAKVLNYGRIYGGAQPFALQLLRQHSHRLGERELERRVAETYSTTKGRRRWPLNGRGRSAVEGLRQMQHEMEVADPLISDLLSHPEEEPWSAGRLARLARLSGAANNWRDLASRPVWFGGTESAMFNKLESLASELHPSTPVLGARLSRGLEPALVGDNFLTSRVNWVVQSSAVDFLHLMTVCMQWLMRACEIEGRFCISIHDEVRYVVRSEHRYRAALALHITNLLTRSLFARRLGLQDLPQAVAFFSGVDVDKALRKDVLDDCRTPSNPHGLAAGYGVPPGEVLDIHQTVERVGSSPMPRPTDATGSATASSTSAAHVSRP